jgi:DNA repair photolyase
MLFLAPVMPGINEAPVDLEAVVARAAEAGAQAVMSQMLFLRSSARRRYLPWLDEQFPELGPLYDTLYGSSGAALAAREARLRETIDHLRTKYGLNHTRGEDTLPPFGTQMSLPL